MGLGALVSKMPFLITIVTNGLAQVLIFLMRWPVAATIIIVLSRSLAHIDPSGRSGALRLETARTAIATILIVSTFLMVPARSFDLRRLGAMRKHGLCLVRAEQKGASVPGIILGRFWGGVVALGAANIYLMDPQKKVKGGLGLSHNGLPNGLVPSVFLTIFLLGLGMDKWL